ncbi:MAG: ComEC/Rec2 family competence protein [Solirubrobacteraceae bacterium]|nr:ComEC/Rec2 family competence protein [Solirubrobacteraceae bacterium]
MTRLLAAHPRHAVLGGIAIGLLVAGCAPALMVPAAGLAGLAVGPRGSWRLGAGLVLAVLCGTAAGHVRLEALTASALGPLPRFGELRVVVVEAPAPRAHGFSEAAAEVRAGAGAGERVVLRLGPPAWRGAARWPREPIGTVVRVEGELRPLGPFDSAQARRHAHAVVRVHALSVGQARRGGLAGVIDGIRRRAERAIDAALPRQQAALARGMVLGQDDALGQETEDLMRATGLSHLVAASGANIALLATLVLALGGACGLALRPRLIVALVAVAAYVPLAGAGPSIQRAGVMGGAALVAALAGRPATRWYALLLAAVVTLALNPLAAGDPGWQLSFAAVLALLLVAPPLRTALARRIPNAVAEPLAVTLAATLGTAPLLALHFERLSIVSPLINVLAAPVVAPIMWLGTIASGLGQLSPAVARPPALLAAPLLAYLDGLAAWGAALPAAEVELGLPARLVLAVACLGLLAVVSHPRARDLTAEELRPRGRRAALAVTATCVLASVVANARPPGPPEGPRVSFLDIGQGDATLLQDGRHAVLVDTGRPESPVLERLRESGARKLDALVMTHGSADHEGNAAAILRTLPVEMLFDGGDPVHRTHGLDAAVAEARRRGIPVVRTDAGQTIRAGRIVLRVLWPDRDKPAEPGADPNLGATVFDARVGGMRVLLPADAESVITNELEIGRVDALKVAHHGSADDGLPDLLRAIRPSAAVIPTGPNTYGHPTPGTVRALKAAVPLVRRTDRDGTVRLRPRAGGGVEVLSGR